MPKPNHDRTSNAEERGTRWDSRSSLDARRDDILRSLGTFLRNNRLSSLKMQDIADQLRMTKGNLYYYFRNKQDILYHCHLKSMEISLSALRDAEQCADSPSVRLHSLLKRHIHGITDEAYGAVLLTDLESLAPAQRRSYVVMRDRFEKGIRKIIEEGIARGEFRTVDARIAGFAFLGAINWISKWYQPNKGMSSHVIAEQFVDLFMNSLRSQLKKDGAKSSPVERGFAQSHGIAGWRFVISDSRHDDRETWAAHIQDLEKAHAAFVRVATLSQFKSVSVSSMTAAQIIAAGLANGVVKLIEM
jgi:AcrR family transcriptional regulator